MAQLCTDFGFTVTQVSFYYTIKNIAGALFAGILTKIFFKWKKLLFMLLNILAITASFVILTEKRSMWNLCVSAVLHGAVFSTSATIVPYILDKQFSKGANTAIGLAMAFSGIGGMLFNPVTSELIQLYGCTNAVKRLGVITILIAVSGIYLIYAGGWKFKEKSEKSEGRIQDLPSVLGNVKKNKKQFFMCCCSLAGGALGLQFTSYISIYAQNAGYSLFVGASLTSAVMLGNVGGKLLFGIVCDKRGVWKTMKLFSGCVFVASFCFAWLYNCLPILYIASVLYGFVFALFMMSVYRLAMEVYGAEDSKKHTGTLTLVNNAAGAVACLGIGILYDGTQSFSIALLIEMSICLCSAAAVAKLEKNVCR